MCHDVNPLGTTMHLKELDRQAAGSRRPLSSTGAWIGSVKQRQLGAFETPEPSPPFSQRPC